MSKCICNEWYLQTESKEGDFYDPGNWLPRDHRGRKIRRYWLGCPVHNGNTNQVEPTIEAMLERAKMEDKP